MTSAMTTITTSLEVRCTSRPLAILVIDVVLAMSAADAASNESAKVADWVQYSVSWLSVSGTNGLAFGSGSDGGICEDPWSRRTRYLQSRKLLYRTGGHEKFVRKIPDGRKSGILRMRSASSRETRTVHAKRNHTMETIIVSFLLDSLLLTCC
jgi:hypothetical protein